MAEGSDSFLDDPSYSSEKARGGWRAVKYILANETFEKLASMSLIANMTVYLKTKYNMNGILVVNVINIWSGSSSFTSIGGAMVSDTFLGRYLTLLFGSISSTLGMAILTLTAAVPKLRPPTCIGQINCIGPKFWQLSILYVGLAFVAIGAGGIRPCNIAFGADQFDTRTKKGRMQLESFFNWWKHHLDVSKQMFYDPEVHLRTKRFRCLEKAAIIADQSELDEQGKPKNGWRLCSIQQVENLKLLLGMMPVWVTGIGCFMAMDQQSTIGILQAIQTNNTLGSSFKVPPGWMGLSSMIALAFWIFIYEIIWVLQTKRITGKAKRLSMTQRTNIGLVFAMACSIVAALVEKKRRTAALQHGSFQSPMSIVMLMPQFALSGLIEAFAAVALMEYLTTQLPESMRTGAGAIFFVSLSLASYLNSILINIVYKVTRKGGKTAWLGGPDLNQDKLERFYYLMAALEALNFIYFNLFARQFITNASTVSTGSEGLHNNEDQTLEYESPPSAFDLTNSFHSYTLIKQINTPAENTSNIRDKQKYQGATVNIFEDLSSRLATVFSSLAINLMSHSPPLLKPEQTKAISRIVAGANMEHLNHRTTLLHLLSTVCVVSSSDQLYLWEGGKEEIDSITSAME
ncbi:hypothetical protein V6N11_039631 [Hibiscus sabdariffa]|uniref:Protein NRT1/ PTR FAMILY 2.8 n=1 Tax=Hibiscus sabdariffa TaxID=183260 RepID=A0ABR2SPE7_9ROSI